MNLIESHGLRIGYDATTDMACPDFAIGPEDFLCVMGPNGSGKSALVKTLAGLMPPRAGELVMSDGLQDGGIGYLPQRTPLQDDFPATVREIVRTGCQSLRGLRPFFSCAEKDMAERALIRFGLADLAHRPYRSLSGGQRRRALLARALCVPRRLLLLDEPTAGLDEQAVETLYACLASLRTEGLAILMVTHERTSVHQLASHVLRMGQRAAFRAVTGRKEEVRDA